MQIPLLLFVTGWLKFIIFTSQIHLDLTCCLQLCGLRYSLFLTFLTLTLHGSGPGTNCLSAKSCPIYPRFCANTVSSECRNLYSGWELFLGARTFIHYRTCLLPMTCSIVLTWGCDVSARHRLLLMGVSASTCTAEFLLNVIRGFASLFAWKFCQYFLSHRPLMMVSSWDASVWNLFRLIDLQCCISSREIHTFFDISNIVSHMLFILFYHQWIDWQAE